MKKLNSILRILSGLLPTSALTLSIGLAGLAVSLSMSPAAHAGIDLPYKRTIIAPINVSGLKNWIGNYMTVYYAVYTSSGSIINQDPNKIALVLVRVQKQNIPITSDSLSIESVAFSKISTDPEMSKANLYPSYNRVVFVVHQEKDFSWQNAGADAPSLIPMGIKDTGNHTKIATAVVSSQEIQIKNGEKVVSPLEEVAPMEPINLNLATTIKLMEFLEK